MEDLMNNVWSTIITAAGYIITLIFKILEGLNWKTFTYKIRNEERKNLIRILKEIGEHNFSNDIKNIVLNKYDNNIIRNLCGFNISLEQYKIILESKILDKYSASQVKISNRFFEYIDHKIEVNISCMNYVSATVYFILSLLFILFGFSLLVFKVLINTPDLLNCFKNIGFSLLPILYGFWTISTFVAPVNVAHTIKKHLKKQ